MSSFGTRRERSSTEAPTHSKASVGSLKLRGTLTSTNRDPKTNPRCPRKSNSLCKLSAVEKPALTAPNIGSKRSSSSCPRGRSPSPSQIIRVFREPSSKNSDSAEKLSTTKTTSDCKENLGSFSEKHYETDNSGGILRDGKSKFGSSSAKRADTLILENSRDRRLSEDGGRSRSSAKQSSKLHEKLAFLECKVKKIASDIKKTKEMLDMGNPESSKQVLVHLRDNISGMEKQVLTNVDDEPQRTIEVTSPKKTTSEPSKVSIRLLNSAKLEARLLPHYKLLRNRIVACSQETIESKPNDGNIQESGSSATKEVDDIILTSDEKFDDWDDGGKAKVLSADEGMQDVVVSEEKTIGTKNCRGGWFVSEGESVLLTHDDGSCTFHDITNGDEKSIYKSPAQAPSDIWGDCWVVRATGSDGAASKLVVAASSWKSTASGFCSWDFYSKQIKAFHVEVDEKRPVLAPLPVNTGQKKNSLSSLMWSDRPTWWYRPCGALLASTCSGQRFVKMFDIRDGEPLMDWELGKPVADVDFSSPLQWRNRGKVVVAEGEMLSVWDVNSQFPLPLQSISSASGKISGLHVINADAEPGGGVRQRVSGLEGEGNDGVFCTSESINMMDLRVPTGVGVKMAKRGYAVECAYTRGDSVYVGGCGEVAQYSVRGMKKVCGYGMPDGEVTQVWGDSDTVMAATEVGLFVFRPTDGEVAEVIGSGNLSSPSFDYSHSQLLLVSVDRPALYKTLSSL